jgi:hypothetical protein
MRFTRNGVFKFTRSHRPNLVQGLKDNKVKKSKKIWISPSKLYNFVYKNTLVDWLNMYGGNSSRTCYTPSSFNLIEGDQNESFKNFIMSKGVEFEDHVVNMLKSKFPDNYQQLSSVHNIPNFNSTLNFMKEGVPLIFSGSVRNASSKTYGICDILIRSDYISTVFDNLEQELELETYNNQFGTTNEFIPAPKLGNKNYHYRVIDVKFSTLHLASNGLNMLNNVRAPFYKTQLYIYNEALGEMQGYKSNYAYILGRKWTYKKNANVYNGNNCVTRFGVVDFTSKHDENTKELVKDGLNWITDLTNNGSNWDIDNPDKFELYPNMGVDSGRWNEFKKDYAEKLGEITMIWQCGYKNRKIAFSKGIKSWKHKNCSAQTLGINGSYAKLVDKIITINRDSKNDVIMDPQSFKKDCSKVWQNVGKNGDVFVDFETISDIFSGFNNLPYTTSAVKPEIFMIGVYFQEGDTWKYKSYILNKLDIENERKQMTDFANFVEGKNIYYWYAEKMFWDRNLKKYPELKYKNLNFIDLCKVFKSEEIVLKNCFNFGLKSIAKAMYAHKMINTHIESECSNGMMAMIKAWNCYNSCENPEKHPIMKDIEKYNEFDCKVLFDILNYLRSKIEIA